MHKLRAREINYILSAAFKNVYTSNERHTKYSEKYFFTEKDSNTLCFVHLCMWCVYARIVSRIKRHEYQRWSLAVMMSVPVLLSYTLIVF